MTRMVQKGKNSSVKWLIVKIWPKNPKNGPKCTQKCPIVAQMVKNTKIWSKLGQKHQKNRCL